MTGWMINLMRRAMDAWFDDMMRRMLTDPYTENVFATVTVAQKLGVRNIVEAALRAETGRPASRPIGSPVVQSPWESLLFNPVHLWRMPTPDGVDIDSSVVIGPRARKPLRLEIPILIAGMSWGGALSIKAKVALGRGATRAGTASNTGEAPLLPEERAANRFLIGQYNRGGWLNDPESLAQLDAIEIQLGQGAQGSAPMSTASHQLGHDYQRLFRVEPGHNAVIHSRLPGVDSPQEFIRLVGGLRRRYDVPVGLKIAATHWLERELAIALDAGVDFVTVDGAEGGTHGGPVILQDDLGLPTLFAVHRAARFLEQQGARGDVTLLATGSLRNPGHFLKAMALGADAAYIGSIALVAMSQTQMTKAALWEPPPQLVLYLGKFTEDLDVEAAAEHLAKFLKACVAEMKQVAYATGRSALSQFGRSDLVSVDPELARVLAVDYAGYPPEAQEHPPARSAEPAWMRPEPVQQPVH